MSKLSDLFETTSASAKPAPTPCATCGVMVEPKLVMGRWLAWSQCDGCATKEKHARWERQAEDTERQIAEYMIASGFSGRDLKSKNAALIRGLQPEAALRELHPDGPRWMLFVHGVTGSGKTCRAVWWADYLLHGWPSTSVRYATETEIMLSLQPGGGHTLRDWVNVNALVIDETGRYSTAFAHRMMLELINQRHRRDDCLTMLISQETLESTSEPNAAGQRVYDASTYNRIWEAGGSLFVGDVDHRTGGRRG